MEGVEGTRSMKCTAVSCEQACTLREDRNLVLLDGPLVGRRRSKIGKRRSLLGVFISLSSSLSTTASGAHHGKVLALEGKCLVSST